MKNLLLPAVLIFIGLVLAGCGSAPPLVSDKYLNDSSLLTENPCGAPCFQGITIGQTTFADAERLVRDNPLFKDVQSQENPPQAAWSAVNGDQCCVMTADPSTGIVNQLLVYVAPNMRVRDVLAKYGEPAYVAVPKQDYSQTEAVLGLIYPKQGNLLWVMPGDGQSTLDEDDPIVIVLYLNPADFDDLLATAELNGWLGYVSVAEYRSADPVLTPRVTVTPAQ
ncbi:MAG: hypothetical protein DYG88_14360 [Chloroflexi bacterium CFX4]|nr:hypothetical protein [Chloroflexi bacterium CFX4]MDL1923788.1 hypothetical protein [Chloroflexi bacterium CFX3]